MNRWIRAVMMLFLLLSVGNAATAFAAETKDDPARPKLVAQTGHSMGTIAAYISPDGRYVLSGGMDRILKLWELTSGREIRSFIGHTDNITSVSILPDGVHAVSGSSDASIIIWDLITGNEVGRLYGHNKGVTSLHFINNKNLLISGGEDGLINIWDIASKKIVKTYTGHKAQVLAVTTTDDGLYAVSGDSAGILKIWNISTAQEIHSIQGHSKGVTAVSFSPNGDLIISGSFDTSIKLWESKTGRLIKIFSGHKENISSVRFLPDNRHFLSSSFDASLRKWDITSSKTIVFASIPSEKRSNGVFLDNAITFMAITPDGNSVVTGCFTDELISVWNINTGEKLQQFYGRQYVEPFINFKDSTHKLSIGFDLWDFKTGTKETRAHILQQKDLITTPDKKLVLRLTDSNDVDVYDVAKNSKIRTLKGHTDTVLSAACLPDNIHVITSAADKTLRLWDINTGKNIKIFTGHTDWITSVSVTHDGKYAISGGIDMAIIVWDISSGFIVKTFKNDAQIESVVALLDSKYIASTDWNGATAIWQISSNLWLAKLYSFTDGTWAVVDPKGRFDASNGGNVKGLHWVVGNEPIDLAQLKERYYEPGLLAKIMGFNKDPLRQVDAFSSVALFPEVSVTPPSEKQSVATIKLANRGGGIGKVRVLVNGKEVAADARGPKPDPEAKAAELPVEIPESLLIPGQENSIQVLAWNKEGYLSSRGEPIRFRAPSAAKVDPPTLHAIIVGVSQYAEPAMNLTFSGKDAADMATALSISAKRLFGLERTNITLLSDYPNKTEGIHTLPPTRENIQNVFASLKKAKPTDILVVYLAGHGVMAGSGDAGDYYYLTPSARSTNLSDPAIRDQYGISSAELTEWIKQVPALKQVMVLDTCAAGGAAAKLVEKRDLSSSQIRSLERLKDRTGFHVLMGAAADKSSLEASQYGQGLLTWAILQGMKGAALREGEYVDVQKLFQHAADKVPELAKSIGGIQRPIVAAPRGTSFDIGLVDDKTKPLIPLATVKPMILRASFQDNDEMDDIIALSKQVNKLLRDQSVQQRGDVQLVYVDADELPGAWRMTGRYQRNGDKLTVTVILKDGKTRKEFIVTASNIDIRLLANEIVRKAEELVRGE